MTYGEETETVVSIAEDTTKTTCASKLLERVALGLVAGLAVVLVVLVLWLALGLLRAGHLVDGHLVSLVFGHITLALYSISIALVGAGFL